MNDDRADDFSDPEKMYVMAGELHISDRDLITHPANGIVEGLIPVATEQVIDLQARTLCGYLATDLEAASTVLQERGWCRKQYQAKNGAVDVGGALSLAVSGQADPAVLDLFERRRFEFAYDEIAEWVACDPYYWNDHLAKRKRNVQKVMGEIIRELNAEPDELIPDGAELLDEFVKAEAGGYL